MLRWGGPEVRVSMVTPLSLAVAKTTRKSSSSRGSTKGGGGGCQTTSPLGMSESVP